MEYRTGWVGRRPEQCTAWTQDAVWSPSITASSPTRTGVVHVSKPKFRAVERVWRLLSVLNNPGHWECGRVITSSPKLSLRNPSPNPFHSMLTSTSTITSPSYCLDCECWLYLGTPSNYTLMSWYIYNAGRLWSITLMRTMKYSEHTDQSTSQIPGI